MNKDSKIYVAGHTGLVGSAITRNLQKKGYKNLIFSRHTDCDLTNQEQTRKFFEKNKPEYVFLAAAKVGGIIANNVYRAEFIYDNLQIQNNVIHQSYLQGVKKLLFLGSSCIYPKNSRQPIKEEYLLTDELEYTNEPYAIAKIAGMKMCENYNIQYKTNFVSVMPTNLYGPNDNFDLEKSHVLPALVRKIHLAKCFENNDFDAIRKDFTKNPVEGIDGKAQKKQIIEKLNKYGILNNQGQNVELTLWGSGNPRREFLHSQDMADACVFIMENIDFSEIIEKKNLIGKEIKNTHINIGTGKDLSIKELAATIKQIVGFNGIISWDTAKPDGTHRKLLNVDAVENLGWKYNIELNQGLKLVYQEYCQ